MILFEFTSLGHSFQSLAENISLMSLLELNSS